MSHYPVEAYIAKRLIKRAWGPGVEKLIQPYLNRADAIFKDIVDFAMKLDAHWGKATSTFYPWEDIEAIWSDIVKPDYKEPEEFKQAANAKLVNLLVDPIWAMAEIIREIWEDDKLATETEMDPYTKELSSISVKVQEFYNDLNSLIDNINEDMFKYRGRDYWSVD